MSNFHLFILHSSIQSWFDQIFLIVKVALLRCPSTFLTDLHSNSVYYTHFVVYEEHAELSIYNIHGKQEGRIERCNKYLKASKCKVANGSRKDAILTF